ncbi:hypothetical protein DRO33_04445, partial [Candidatus Bathyarchaeota archaeon]
SALSGHVEVKIAVYEPTLPGEVLEALPEGEKPRLPLDKSVFEGVLEALDNMERELPEDALERMRSAAPERAIGIFLASGKVPQVSAVEEYVTAARGAVEAPIRAKIRHVRGLVELRYDELDEPEAVKQYLELAEEELDGLRYANALAYANLAGLAASGITETLVEPTPKEGPAYAVLAFVVLLLGATLVALRLWKRKH